MTTLNVGSGQTYSTISAAIAAASSGDTVAVQAGNYTNDFLQFNTSLNLQAVGGTVNLTATVSPPNGKAIITEGGPGVSVTIDGFAISGAAVGDQNGAAIRYQGGNLAITNSRLFNNQEGILGNADPTGTISIDHSQIDHNGAGDGYSHNIYIGNIASFSLTNSVITEASVGHEVKSRAQTNVITGNQILDNGSDASYQIDLPNGGNATITGNTIQKSANSGNPNIIAYGEEGNLHDGTTLNVSGNVIVTDKGTGHALWNAAGSAGSFSNNSIYGLDTTALVTGPASQSGNTILGTRPSLDLPGGVIPVVPPTPVDPGTSGLVIQVSEDAYQGDAQFTVTVDGNQVGGVRTTTAQHGAGQSQAIKVDTVLGSGAHQIGVTFINDAYDPATGADRNLYIDGATVDGQSVAGAAAGLFTNSTAGFRVGDAGAGQGTSSLVFNVSEDAFQGDAQFTVSVDGNQIGGIRTATAQHGAGQSQAITVETVLGSGAHRIGLAFINDAYDPATGADRNLFLDGATLNGQTIAGATAALYTNSTASFGVGGSGQDTGIFVLNVSEDAYQGDAQFTVAIDGQAQGGVYSVTAQHGLGQSQAITLSGIDVATPHDIAVSFFNDAWGGTPATDRNLYIDGATLNGQAVGGAPAALMINSTQHLTTLAPANLTG